MHLLKLCCSADGSDRVGVLGTKQATFAKLGSVVSQRRESGIE